MLRKEMKKWCELRERKGRRNYHIAERTHSYILRKKSEIEGGKKKKKIERGER